MYCTDPGEVEHSTRLISDPVLLVGTTIQYTCNPGFVLEGSSLLTCYSRETGTPIWTSRLPHCVCKRAALGQLLLLPSAPRDLPCTETVPRHLRHCRVSPCGQAGCDLRSCLPGPRAHPGRVVPFQPRSRWRATTRDCRKTATKYSTNASTCPASP